jgi:hypothetical protein
MARAHHTFFVLEQKDKSSLLGIGHWTPQELTENEKRSITHG